MDTKSEPKWTDFSEEIRQAAELLEHARVGNYQIEPLSQKQMPGLGQRKGYEISAAVRALREDQSKDKVMGRKIGFSNQGIWPEYGIDRSNWSWVYEQTFTELPEADEDQDKDPIDVDISHFSQLQPRIEPEIILCVDGGLSSAMSDTEILERIVWIAHGFEIVVSIFPDWKFTAADTTAAFALHGQLLRGRRRTIDRTNPQEMLDQLANFNISLKQNEQLADEGKGSNVLGSPVKALRHLLELLEEADPSNRLQQGEIVTTGTLTRALPINNGDIWSTELSGIDLPGMRVRFKTS